MVNQDEIRVGEGGRNPLGLRIKGKRWENRCKRCLGRVSRDTYCCKHPMGVFAPVGRYYTLKIPTIYVGRVGGKSKKETELFYSKKHRRSPGSEAGERGASSRECPTMFKKP